MSSVNRPRLKAIIAEKKRSARNVSLEAGLGETAVKDILTGRNKRPALDTLAKIAAEVGVPMTDFVSAEPTLPDSRQSQIVPAHLPVLHKVAAGVWLSKDEYSQDFIETPQAVVPDHRYADWPQWLELVEGESMNKLIPPGRYVHVVDAIEMGYAPRQDDLVVVERRRMGGHLKERTLKQVVINGQGIELWPRSTDARYQAPLALSDSDETTEIEVVGLVIGAYWAIG